MLFFFYFSFVFFLFFFLKLNREKKKRTSVKTVVHNVILGKMWLDHFGETEVINHQTGEKAKVKRGNAY